MERDNPEPNSEPSLFDILNMMVLHAEMTAQHEQQQRLSQPLVLRLTRSDVAWLAAQHITI